MARAALIASVPEDESSTMAAAAAYPDRFYAFAMVNPWVEHAEVVKGLHAICLFPAMHLYSIQDKRVEVLLEQAAAHRCAVFVHCGVLSVGVRKKLGLPSPFDMRYSNPIDLHAVALRHPNVRFIMPHFGAGYFREALMLADLCPNVYLDTSSSNSWMRYEVWTCRRFSGVRSMWLGRSGCYSGRTRRSFRADGIARSSKYRFAHCANWGSSGDDARQILGGNLRRILTEF